MMLHYVNRNTTSIQKVAPQIETSKEATNFKKQKWLFRANPMWHLFSQFLNMNDYKLRDQSDTKNLFYRQMGHQGIVAI